MELVKEIEILRDGFFGVGVVLLLLLRLVCTFALRRKNFGRRDLGLFIP
jgi:hypothetical protein